MEPGAVGRLHNRDVGPQFGNVDPLNSALGERGKVSGVKNSALICHDIHAGRACDMPRRIEGDGKAVRYLHGGLIPDGGDAV